MKKKTKDKLERKWQNLSVHHMDVCVVIEDLMLSVDNYVSCERYLNKVGYKYSGVISISALGEIFMYLVKRLKKEKIERQHPYFLAKHLHLSKN
ncbi:MAG: hypothetical protein QMD06_04275 [Candidatus Altarchaeum sp.]|nr:hypothetical protein [Candidatus Altarchaeum sp.]